MVYRMKIVVFGSTGGIGKHLLEQALERGHNVTAVARNPATITLSHPNLKIRQGDIYNADDVATAIRGQDVVLSALGSKTPKKLDPVTSTGIRNMLRAMRQEGIHHIIAISSIGVGDPKEYAWWVRTLLINFVYKTFAKYQLDDINEMEQELIRSEENWVIVRPTTLTNGRRKGQYFVSSDSRQGIRFYISRADVADMMIKLAETGSNKREILHVGYD